MPAKHAWEFKSRLRTNGFAWNGTARARQRLNEAVHEIKVVAKTDPVTAAEGVVALLERIWPAFQCVDTSSGALPDMIRGVQAELLPLIGAAPTDRKTRGQWLDRLWKAIEDDGVSYLSPTGEGWGELWDFLAEAMPRESAYKFYSLAEEEITSIESLSARSRNELLAIDGIGRTFVGKVEHALASRGLGLRAADD